MRPHTSLSMFKTCGTLNGFRDEVKGKSSIYTFAFDDTHLTISLHNYLSCTKFVRSHGHRLVFWIWAFRVIGPLVVMAR